METKHLLVSLVALCGACASDTQEVSSSTELLSSKSSIDIIDSCRGWHVSLPLPSGFTAEQAKWEDVYTIVTPSGAEIEYPRVSDISHLQVAQVTYTQFGNNFIVEADYIGSSDRLLHVSGHDRLQTLEGLNFGTFLSHGATAQEMQALLSGFTYEGL